MGFDVSELIATRDRLEKLIKDEDKILKAAINEIALRLYRLVVRDTPVDSGWLRMNWEIGAIQKRGNEYYVEIINPVEYAEWVEDGHRIVVDGVTIGWVEGFFMLKINEKKIDKVKDRIIKRHVDAWLKDVFK